MSIPLTFHITIFPKQDTPDSITHHTSSSQIQVKESRGQSEISRSQISVPICT